MTARSQSSIKNSRHVGRNPGNLYSGKVIAVNMEDTSVDVRMYAGDTLRHVRILFNSAHTTAGWHYLASVQNVNPHQTKNGVQDTAMMSNIADMIAVIGFLDENLQSPRVMGFDFPVNSQMHLNEPGLEVKRHESGVYTVIDKNGHHETHYPDGSYVIFASDSSSKSMSSIQGNGQAWSTPSGPTRKMTVHLSEGIDITSDGAGTLNVHASTAINMSAPTGKININGTAF